jgi:hypothetical protein
MNAGEFTAVPSREPIHLLVKQSKNVVAAELLSQNLVLDAYGLVDQTSLPAGTPSMLKKLFRLQRP